MPQGVPGAGDKYYRVSFSTTISIVIDIIHTIISSIAIITIILEGTNGGPKEWVSWVNNGFDCVLLSVL